MFNQLAEYIRCLVKKIAHVLSYGPHPLGGVNTSGAGDSRGHNRKVRRRVVGVQSDPALDNASNVPFANHSPSGTIHSILAIVIPITNVLQSSLLPLLSVASETASMTSSRRSMRRGVPLHWAIKANGYVRWNTRNRRTVRQELIWTPNALMRAKR